MLLHSRLRNETFTLNKLTCCVPVFDQVSAERPEEIQTLVVQKPDIVSSRHARRINDSGGVALSSPKHVVVDQFVPLFAHTTAVQKQITRRHVRQDQP